MDVVFIATMTPYHATRQRSATLTQVAALSPAWHLSWHHLKARRC
ncbi:hypothetical protein Pan216_16170 [Planctomycetes bacterium Pan216]|uniref:Uncharacterized protein n=1 Tax=Kolteria novifilia TaxID=2527975 RepID=A0A518B1G3_9BACT|nr:hypothetical protein Pan216_16170 [Planctomycetes bacterium Pan216]